MSVETSHHVEFSDDTVNLPLGGMVLDGVINADPPHVAFESRGGTGYPASLIDALPHEIVETQIWDGGIRQTATAVRMPFEPVIERAKQELSTRYGNEEDINRHFDTTFVFLLDRLTRELEASGQPSRILELSVSEGTPYVSWLPGFLILQAKRAQPELALPGTGLPEAWRIVFTGKKDALTGVNVNPEDWHWWVQHSDRLGIPQTELSNLLQ